MESLQKRMDALEIEDEENPNVPILQQSGPIHFVDTPSSYNPQLGGAAINENTLTVTNASGKELVKLHNISKIQPIISVLLGRDASGEKLKHAMGTLICGWT